MPWRSLLTKSSIALVKNSTRIGGICFFDSLLIKDEYRSAFNIHLKKCAYFFKHADRNPDAEIEFDPELSEGFILYAICGRELSGEPPSEEESTFLWWLHIHRISLLTEKGLKALTDLMPIESIEIIRRVPKDKFFASMREARRLSGKQLNVRLTIEEIGRASPFRDAPIYLLRLLCQGYNPP